MLKINAGQVTVTNTATEIVPARAGRKELRLLSFGGGTSLSRCYAGPDNSVTPSNGYSPSSTDEYHLPIEGAVWGIMSSSSRIVSYLEIYDDGI